MQEEFKAILDRYKTGTASEEDIAFLESWYLQYVEADDNDYAPADQIVDARSVWTELKLDQPEAKRIRLWPRIAAAASVLLILSIGSYLLLHKHKKPQLAAFSHDNVIAPAGNKAILTLSDGRSILLSDVANGLVSQKNGAIYKMEDGALVCYRNVSATLGNPAYDTLITPRGCRFRLVLADGTKIWLNAATSIRYPESFTGKERRVELIKGEAYFEVVHNNAIPFKVVSRNQLIQDIGTHFNIKAYDDEPSVETTLLEGSVSVTSDKQQVVLKPGQLSVIQNTTSAILVKKADPEKTLSWKNDHFVFEDENIKDIMRELSRWYDVDVSYEGDMTGKQLTGSMPRSENMAEVLRKLEETGTVHFRVSGRKIIVTP